MYKASIDGYFKWTIVTQSIRETRSQPTEGKQDGTDELWVKFWIPKLQTTYWEHTEPSTVLLLQDKSQAPVDQV